MIVKTKLGEFFEMTIGDWDNDYIKYRKRGMAYIPISEIAGMKKYQFNSGKVICEIKLKTPQGRGINGIATTFEVPNEEWEELWEYLKTDKGETKKQRKK